jgi:hypothetical protein
MSSLLRKFQRSSLLENFFRGGGRIFKGRLCLRIFFRGGRKNFFRAQKRRRRQSRPVIFFGGPCGFTVPTATSRLGQPTNGGNAGGG